jgi:hypothetical protein
MVCYYINDKSFVKGTTYNCVFCSEIHFRSLKKAHRRVSTVCLKISRWVQFRAHSKFQAIGNRVRMDYKSLILQMPRAGIEPAQPRGPRDFKSLASTYSATQALCCYCFFFIGSLFCATRLGSIFPAPPQSGM